MCIDYLCEIECSAVEDQGPLEYSTTTGTGTKIQSQWLEEVLQSQSKSLVPISLTFNPSQILHLNRLYVPSLKCTSFETLASHTWRLWIQSLCPPLSLKIKLLFSVNLRKRLTPKLPTGYYGNRFVLGCAETTVRELVGTNYPNIHHGVKLVQEAKAVLTEEYVRSMLDYLEERRVKPDLSMSFVISQWAKLGLENLDFGEGMPIDMGPLASEIYCIFLPLVGDLDGVRVTVSVLESVVEKLGCPQQL
ncbi:alcohol acyltransferase 9-like [Telopea speciosissima]|uniref:alcohol acyltransferase 9-like n=1 Tax=Telopea speciosissima TaxID=54955 RepID=UPI001CC662EC|nr:alcohol acyltransferase 9-like [Telopea speciosissima]